jgi:hypothetical protein
VPYIPLPALIEQLPTRASVVQETEQTVARHPVPSQEALDPHIDHEPSPYNRIPTSDRHSNVIRAGVSPGIPDIPPHLPQDGLQETRRNVPADGPPSSTHNPPLRRLRSIAGSMKPVRLDPKSDQPLSRLEVRPEEVRPALNPSRGRMCVGIEFGTAHSGVACGISPDTVEQILAWTESQGAYHAGL